MRAVFDYRDEQQDEVFKLKGQPNDEMYVTQPCVGFSLGLDDARILPRHCRPVATSFMTSTIG